MSFASVVEGCCWPARAILRLQLHKTLLPLRMCLCFGFVYLASAEISGLGVSYSIVASPEYTKSMAEWGFHTARSGLPINAFGSDKRFFR